MRERQSLPMFPLGAVLVPFSSLTLHVFEPRYRALVADCIAGDPEFGIVLIERGSEVGGDDVRFAVGTLARIVEVAEFPDGRSVLVVVGLARLRVERWLPDDPYPRADVTLLEDTDIADIADTGGVADTRVAVERAIERLYALRSELGEPAPALPRLDPDLVRASYESLALAPLGPLDRQRLLELDDVRARLAGLRIWLEEEADLLAQRLGGG